MFNTTKQKNLLITYKYVSIITVIFIDQKASLIDNKEPSVVNAVIAIILIVDKNMFEICL